MGLLLSLKIRRMEKKLDKELERDKKRRLTPHEYLLPIAMTKFDNDGNRISGKDRLMTDFLIENLKLCRHSCDLTDDEKPIHRKAPSDILAHLRTKFISVELRECPICRSASCLEFILKEYTQMEGLAGGYDIFALIHCERCDCRLKEYSVFTNIFNSSEFTYTVDMAYEKIVEAIDKWNTRIGEKNELH